MCKQLEQWEGQRYYLNCYSPVHYYVPLRSVVVIVIVAVVIVVIAAVVIAIELIAAD